MNQQNLAILIALGALAAYIVTRPRTPTYTEYPGYDPRFPQSTPTGTVYYPPGTLDDVYL